MVDVYDDLEHFDISEVHKLREENKTLLYRIFTLEKDNKRLSEIYALSEKNVKRLSTNISSLHKTSTAEIQRKDRIIQEQREKLESESKSFECDRSVNSPNTNQEKYPPQKVLENHGENSLTVTIFSSNGNRSVSRDTYSSKQSLPIRNFDEERYLPETALVQNGSQHNSCEKTLDYYLNAENVVKPTNKENKSFLLTPPRQSLFPRNTKLNLDRRDSSTQIYNKTRSRSRSSEKLQNFYKKRSLSPYENTERIRFFRERSHSRDRKKNHYRDSNYRSKKYCSHRRERHDREDENKNSSRRLERLGSEKNDNFSKTSVERHSKYKTIMGARILTDEFR